MKVYIGKYPNHRWYHHYLYKWFGYSPSQTTVVKIDSWDTWSMDFTLASIVLPMLLQLKKDHHGAPHVDLEDVPEHLHPSGKDEDGLDNTHFDRWEWILDEMIWAFEQKNRDHWEGDYYGDWIRNEEDGGFGGRFEWHDREGMLAHQKRMSNGFRLFGKYYENLWD